MRALLPRSINLTCVTVALFVSQLALAFTRLDSPSLTQTPGSVSQIPARRMTPSITPEVEAQVVEFFTSGNCERAKTAVAPAQYGNVSPLVLAVIAYCEPQGQVPENLFEQAETRDPSNDTIVVLHARYRWKNNPESSLALWQRVLLLARNISTQKLAREYLEGNGQGEEAISVGKSLNYFANIQFGASRETNPLGTPFTDSDTTASLTSNLQFSLGALHGTDFGSLGADYSLLNNRYFSAHEVDLFEHDLDAPVAIRVGKSEDIVFRPFGSFLTLGNSPYQALAGFGILGLAYREAYKQSVQGSIFVDRFFSADSQPQQGTHFRFEYNWEFYPPSVFFKALTFIEHVQTVQDVTSGISYSHNDIGGQIYFDYDFKWILLGFYPKLILREDDDASTYLSATSVTTQKRREEIQFILQPNVTIPLAPYLQIFAWYEWNRTYSNIGPNDYLDRNSFNQTLGVALRTFIANYY